jgi:hypothetical protein
MKQNKKKMMRYTLQHDAHAKMLYNEQYDSQETKSAMATSCHWNHVSGTAATPREQPLGEFWLGSHVCYFGVQTAQKGFRPGCLGIHFNPWMPETDQR